MLERRQTIEVDGISLNQGKGPSGISTPSSNTHLAINRFPTSSCALNRNKNYRYSDKSPHAYATGISLGRDQPYEEIELGPSYSNKIDNSVRGIFSVLEKIEKKLPF